MDVDADLEFFLFVVAGGVVLRVLGQASLRLIEQERDLPHQDELIWGANWLWLLIPSLVAAGWLLVQLAHRLRYYELTTIMIGRLLFPVAVALLLWYKPRAVVGLILWCVTIRHRQHSNFRLAQWLQERDERLWRQRWMNVILHGVVASVAAATVLLIWWYTLPLDRMLMQGRENAALEQMLQREMTGSPVEHVHVYAPDAMAPRDTKLVLGRYAVNADHILLVVPKEEVDALRAEAVIEETRAALRHTERRERWGIVVVQPTGAPSPAQAYYEP